MVRSVIFFFFTPLKMALPIALSDIVLQAKYCAALLANCTCSLYNNEATTEKQHDKMLGHDSSCEIHLLLCDYWLDITSETVKSGEFLYCDEALCIATKNLNKKIIEVSRQQQSEQRRCIYLDITINGLLKEQIIGQREAISLECIMIFGRRSYSQVQRRKLM
jgi:hypothetical protein